jgi:GntR family transcriptional repressor for pyruvate dehydrogenase complex
MAVTDGAILKIKEMIVSGGLKPGARLPREADLAMELGVSRNSLREAVRALSLVRILDVRQGDGTYVSSLQPDVLLDAMGFLLEFHQDSSVLDFLGVRRILEPAATALASAGMTAEQLVELAEEAAAGAAATSVAELVEHDLRFHALIAAGSGNPVLASVLDSIALPTGRARIWRGLTEENAFHRTVLEHEGILQAITARDAALAAARATVHIAGVEDWLRRNRPQE